MNSFVIFTVVILLQKSHILPQSIKEIFLLSTQSYFYFYIFYIMLLYHIKICILINFLLLGYQCMTLDSTPSACPSGTYNLATSPTGTACIECPGGYYCAVTTASPVACDAGMYLNPFVYFQKKFQNMSR